jgi:hypothetical protein
MRLVAYALLVLAACKPSEGEDWPVEPGGGGGTVGGTVGSGAVDAAMDDGTTSTGARVCGMSEILRWDECANAGMEGLDVMVGALSAETLADGTFTIGTPVGANLAWRVSGNAQLASLLEYPGGNVIPSISNTLFQDTAADANVGIENGVGTIFAKVLYMGEPVVGATAELAGSIDLVYYDDANGSAEFSLGETRADGIVWFPNVAPGATVSFTVTPPKAIGEPTTTNVTVEAETATFVTVVIP